jgi:L-amino acid N-acyltransferase YncA
MIEIRDFTASDYPAVLEIDQAEQKTYRAALWDAATAEERVQFLMTSPSHVAVYHASQFCLVANYEGAVIGFLFALPLLPDVLIVEPVAVVPEMRRQGVAKKLYEDLVVRAKRGSIRRIQALISLDNPASMALHVSAGFTLRDRKEAVLPF